MPAYATEIVRHQIALIRRILIRKGEISALQMTEELAKAGTDLDREYVTKLMRQLQVERAARIERLNKAEVNDEIDRFEQLIDELAGYLSDIITNPIGTPAEQNRAKVAAIKELRQAAESLFEKKFDAGIFERQLGKVKAERNLSAEDEALVKTALEHALKPRRTAKDNRGVGDK